MVEHPGCGWVSAWSDVGAGLLVQPPPGQAKLGRHGQRLVMHDAVRFEQCVHVTGSPPRIVGKSHSSPAEHIEVCDHAPPGEPVAKRRKASSMPALSSSGEGSLTLRRSRSRPRTRRACGRPRGHETRACARAPGVSNGNQKRRKPRDADHGERPARLASPGARRGQRRAHPTARRRQAPAYQPATSDAARRLPLVLLQELHDQPPPHIEVRLVRNEGGEPGNAHRLVLHLHRVAKTCHPHSPAGASQARLGRHPKQLAGVAHFS